MARLSCRPPVLLGLLCLLAARVSAGFGADGFGGLVDGHDKHEPQRIERAVTVSNSAELNNALAHFEADNFEDENEQNRHFHSKTQQQTGPVFLTITINGGDYDLEREFFITQGELRLQGDGNVVIRAAEGRRHFTVEDKASVHFEHISLEDGGNDHREHSLGGSIFFKGGDGEFRSVTFKNNRAFAGGAVFIGEANRIEFIDCSFERNKATRAGGAVFVAGAKGKRKHRDHASAWASAAKSLLRKTAVVIFHYTKFEQNDAHHGGAIWTGSERVEVRHSTFLRNTADVGGAIFNSRRGKLLVFESRFEENQARKRAGAIYNAGQLVIVCSIFINNRAPWGRDIVNDGKLRCSAQNPVDIEGKKDGFCKSCAPTPAPTRRPTPSPTPAPTAQPTRARTAAPTTPAPTNAPVLPFKAPPTEAPTQRPTRVPTLSPTRRVFRKKQKKVEKNDIAAKVEAQQEELLRKKQEEQEDQMRAFEDLHQKKHKKQQEEEQEEEWSDYYNPKKDSYYSSGKKEKGKNDYYR